jgi:hypothetical protein
MSLSKTPPEVYCLRMGGTGRSRFSHRGNDRGGYRSILAVVVLVAGSGSISKKIANFLVKVKIKAASFIVAYARIISVR